MTGREECGMARDEFDGVCWGLVRSASLPGLIETVVCEIERLFGGRARAQAMASVATATAAAETGVRADVAAADARTATGR
jgi:hypothetical protein